MAEALIVRTDPLDVLVSLLRSRGIEYNEFYGESTSPQAGWSLTGTQPKISVEARLDRDAKVAVAVECVGRLVCGHAGAGVAGRMQGLHFAHPYEIRTGDFTPGVPASTRWAAGLLVAMAYEGHDVLEAAGRLVRSADTEQLRSLFGVAAKAMGSSDGLPPELAPEHWLHADAMRWDGESASLPLPQAVRIWPHAAEVSD